MDPSLHTKKSAMQFLHGFSFFFKGMRFIKKHSLWNYVILPAIVSLVVAGLLIFFVFMGVSQYILSKFDLDGGFLSTILSILVWIFSAFLSFSLSILFYRVIASLIISPFLGPLLEKTTIILYHKKPEVKLATEIKNIIYTVWVNIKFSFIGIAVLLISLPLGPFQILVMVFLEGYFLGRSSFDPVLDLENKSLRERKKIIKLHFYEILGIGSAFFLFLMIPILGVILAPASGVVASAMIRHGRLLYESTHTET
ncbi:MAG: EI24 domain-containing protein [Spirochaetia bacterium]|nr:EI24 domain-containing protein [Spirochaetia bacterium]